ncbi:MAG: DegV family protein, partial [Candidatus Ventricola sp.]|nr:DegV family protein [Candidatus Ventricola sp.]
ADLKAYKGTSGSSCPNVFDWLNAFGDAENVFAVTITSSLSGSYNAACQAAEEYTAAHPGRKVCVLDSLTAGPELRLICEKVREGILAGKAFEEIEANTRAYMKHTHTIFALQSLNNLARNGRVNGAVAKLAGVLGIWVVGKGSDEGTLQQEHKCRGEKRAAETAYGDMKAHGYNGGKVRMSNCLNDSVTDQLEAIIRKDYPDAEITCEQTTGLCSFYAEQGGMIIGYEDRDA